jgi:hypothetical protein
MLKQLNAQKNQIEKIQDMLNHKANSEFVRMN